MNLVTPPAAPAPHLLAIAGPAADLAQFAREAMWLAQERGLTLTLAVQQRPRWWTQVMGYQTIEDLAGFAERWNISLLSWSGSEDVEGIIGGWTARRPRGVILGPRGRGFFAPGLAASLAARFEESAKAQGVEVIPDLVQDRRRTPLFGLMWRLDERRPWYHAYILSAFAVSLVAALVGWLDGVVPSPGIGGLFLIAVIYSATAYGMAAAVFASASSVLLFSYFFLNPRYDFLPISPEAIFMLVLFLVIAGITSDLAGRLRQQSGRSQRQARETRALFQLTRDIAVAADTTSIFRAIVAQCNDIFDCTTVLLAPASGGGLNAPTVASSRARAAALQVAYPPQAILTQEEIEAARWAYANGAPAGRGTNVGAALDAVFHPLDTADGVVAVLALKSIAREIVDSPGFRRLIGSICRMTALAVDHSLRKQDLENARVTSQTEGLRSALLSAISHDFGTPLASIIGSASSLLSFGKTYSPDVTQELLATILEEAERLNRFVKNVLQMTRLEAGALSPRLQWADVEDLISTSLDAAHRRLANHQIYADIADKLPLVNVDFVLMESVLTNILDNAAKYAPADTDIQIVARRLGGEVAIDVIDQGRGLASEDLGAIFDKFYRARHRDRTVPGTGLGLAICKGIIEAHGGTVEALSEGLGHGTTIRIRLPVKTPDVAIMAEM